MVRLLTKNVFRVVCMSIDHILNKVPWITLQKDWVWIRLGKERGERGKGPLPGLAKIVILYSPQRCSPEKGPINLPVCLSFSSFRCTLMHLLMISLQNWWSVVTCHHTLRCNVCISSLRSYCFGCCPAPSKRAIEKALVAFLEGHINGKLVNEGCLWLVRMSIHQIGVPWKYLTKLWWQNLMIQAGAWFGVTTPALGLFFLCLFVGPINLFLQTPHLSLTGCRVVFGMIIFCVFVGLFGWIFSLAQLAGESPPTPSPNWIVGTIPDQPLTRKSFATIWSNQKSW